MMVPAAAWATAAAVLLTAYIGPWLWDNVVVVGRRLWATRGIPEPPGSFVLGHVPELVGSRFRSFVCFRQWSLQWPLYRIRFLWRPVMVVTDPDLYQPLLRPGASKLPKYTAPYRMFEVFTKPERSNILTSAENATYKAVRKAAVASLTMNNMRLCFPHITAVTQRLIDALSTSGPAAVHDMDAVAAAITVDVIGLAAFNRDLQATCSLPTHTAGATANKQQPAEAPSGPAPATGREAGQTSHGNLSNSTQTQATLSSASDSTAGGAAAPAGIAGSVAFPRGREVLEVISHLVVAMQGRMNPFNRWFPWRQAYRDLFYWGGRMSDLVHDLTSSMEAVPPPAHSLGAHLLKACYSTGQPLDREQIMAEIGIMWGAGFETTAHTICWTLFLLATNPEAEARLCAELDILGLLATPDAPNPTPLQWEHLGQLKYLSAVINESMRLYPVASSGTIRITDRPMTLAGPTGVFSLPPGQPIMIPFYAIHRSPRLWTDPDTFKPERFLTADAAAAAAPAPAAEGRDSASAAGAQACGAVGAAAGAAGSRIGQAGGGSSSNTSSGLADDYVDVAADIAADIAAAAAADTAAIRDQHRPASTTSKQQAAHAQQQPGPLRSQDSSNKRASPTLELKDPTVDRRGFLPFSIGSRNCVGQALALVELKAVLALLLGSFAFTLHPSMGGAEGVDASAKQTVTLRPEHGLLMTLTPRAAGTAPSQPAAQ